MRRPGEPRRRHSRFYAHATGIVGAASLLNIFKDLIEWRSFIVGFIIWWQAYVRPVVHYLFWWVPDVWPWHWPEWGYDYITFAFVFGFGGVRFFELFMPVWESYMGDLRATSQGTPYDVRMKQRIAWTSIISLVLLFFFVSLLWPLFLTGLSIFLLLTWINGEFRQPVREALFLALSPFLYFMVVLILNYAFFFAGVK